MSCLFPRTVYVPTRGRKYTVPCNNCYMCRMAKAQSISTRMKYEAKRLIWLGKGSSFVTLTLSDFWLNLTHIKHSYTGSRYSLNKDFAKNFYHNLYMRLSRKGYDFKLFLCGEYGDKFSRPHYHMIVCGVPANELAPILYNMWLFGKIDCQTAGSKSFDYVTKYILKQQKRENVRLYKMYGLEPPFSIRSQGIGYQYMLENRDMLQSLGGFPKGDKIIPLPSYYARKLGFLDEKKEKLSRDNLSRMASVVSNYYGFNIPASEMTASVLTCYMAYMSFCRAQGRNRLHNQVVETIPFDVFKRQYYVQSPAELAASALSA